MMKRTGKISVGPGGWLAGLVLCAFLSAIPAFGWVQHDRPGRGYQGGFSGFPAHENRGQVGRNFDGPRYGGREMRAPRQDQRQMQNQPRQNNRREMQNQPREDNRREMQQQRPDYRQGRPGARGQEHFSQWWQQHRELSPQQQADALRRQPGFQGLPRGQQQRLINRLRDFDRRPPREQQRTLGRVEMFERLSPQRKQEVRGASQALGRMAPQRQRVMRQAFHELRQMPPDQRQRMLHSQFGAQFTPQERTVLGNLLAIEPYQGQGQSQQIPQPYFGRH
jgi:hypothetical protein